MKLVLAMVLLLPLSFVQAREAVDDLLSLSLEDLLKLKVTGSTLTAESRKTVPSAVTVFTHDEIRRMGLDYLDELIFLVPGFQSFRTSFSAMINRTSARGRSLDGLSSGILILVDGQRVVDPRSSSSGIILRKFPLNFIERVEFIRGPGSAVYGSNAMLGVINIITRRSANELSFALGSLERQQFSWHASTALGQASIDLFARFEQDQGKDYTMADVYTPAFIRTSDARELVNFNVRASWQQSQLMLEHRRDKEQGFYQHGTLSEDFNRGESEFTAFSLKQDFHWYGTDAWLWLGYHTVRNISYLQFSAAGDLAGISQPSSDAPLYVNSDFDDATEQRLQWHNSRSFSGQSSVQFGLEYRHIKAPKSLARNNFDLAQLVNGQLPVTFYGELKATSVLQAGSQRDVFGLYGQYRHQLFKDTVLTLGARYDHFSQIGDKLSPRLALVHGINEYHSLKLLYGQAFQAPNEAQQHIKNNPVTLGNPGLKPETVKTSELIWLAQWPDTAFSLGYFENHFEDAILLQDNPEGGTVFGNTRQSPVKGFEFEYSYQLSPQWLLRGNYSHFSEKPDLSFREADQLGAVMVNYQQDKWNVNVIAGYYGQRQTPTGGSEMLLNKLGSYWLVFTKLSYHFSAGLLGYLQVKNLLDKTYRTPTQHSNLKEAAPQRGREILAGITWKF